MYEGMNTSGLLDALRSAYFEAVQKNRKRACLISQVAVKAAVLGHRSSLEGAIKRLFEIAQ